MVAFRAGGRRSAVVFRQSGGLLTTTRGAFTLTGYDVTFRLLRAGASALLVADTGAFSMTGSSAVLNVTRPSAAGSFAMTGKDANLTVTRAPGSVSLSGLLLLTMRAS